MKLMLLGILCILPVAFGSEQDVFDTVENWSHIFDINFDKCVKESGVDENEARKVFKTLKFPEDYNFKCFIKCQMLSLDFLNSKGEFNIQNVINQAKDADEKTLKEGQEKASFETDLCDKAFVHQDVFDTVQKWNKLFDQNFEKCVKESGVDETEAKNLFKTLKFPEDRNFKCYVKCQMLSLGFFNSKGEVNIQNLISQAKNVDEKSVKEAVEVASAETDLCDKLFAYLRHGAKIILKRIVAE
ncbi:hypothetical protein FQA39_LY17667 [Lamprigera yunnana]|nr:hypothetical protein FQA39_LY17667 [Lamprigera yunnana]